MPEQVEIHFKLEQRPIFDIDVDNPAEARAWRRRVVEDEITLLGRLPTRMVVIGKGFMRFADFPPAEGSRDMSTQAAMFRMVATLPDAVRGYREGEVLAGGQRHAAIFEWDPRSESWTLLRRRLGTNQVNIGVMHGAWEESSGVGLDGLDPSLREWVDTTDVELGASRSHLTPKQVLPDIRMRAFELEVQPPLDAKSYADRVGEIVDREAMAALPTGLGVLVFRGLKVEQYLIEGETEIPLDDLVRAIANRGPAEAVAVVALGVVDLNGESHRAIVTNVECAGRLYDRALALKFGPGGKVVGFRAVGQERGPVKPEGCWLGVAPKNGEVDLFPLGPAGPTGEG